MSARSERRTRAQRTAVLEAEVRELRTELAALRSRLAPEPDRTPRAPRQDAVAAVGTGEVSRRGLLRGVGLAAGSGVAVALTGGVLGPAAAGAAPGDPVRIDQVNFATGTTSIEGGPDPTLVVRSGGGSAFPIPTAAIQGSNADGAGVTGISDFGAGVLGTTHHVAGIGVHGDITEPLIGATAVLATTAGMGSALDAIASNPASSASAVHVAGAGQGGAVFAEVTHTGSKGPALLAQTLGTGNVVQANLFNPGSVSAAIVARTNGRGPAIRGDILSGSGATAMHASNAGSGAAMRAEQSNPAATAPAVRASAAGSGAGIDATSGKGIGGTFSGARAAVRLVPTTTTGSPSSGAHSRGELIVDAAGAMFVCTSSGTPGTWRKVQLV